MALYPINLQLASRNCAVIGGGAVAERKITDLLSAGAVVSVISPVLSPVLERLAKEQKIEHLARPYRPGDLAHFFIVICATDNKAVNEAAAWEAKAAGALVNVVDNPQLCDFSVPAKVVRGDLVITVSTSGYSPALAKQLRLKLEKEYGPEYEMWLEIIGTLRSEMKEKLSVSKERELFWQQAMDETVLALVQEGRLKEAEERIRHAIGRTWSES